MEILSYNEEKQKALRLRHLFFPGFYNFICEAVIAVVALIVFNSTEMSNRLLNDPGSNNNPFEYFFGLLGNSYQALEKYYIFQQIYLFLLWAMFGVLLYVLLFRLFYFAFGFSSSVKKGVVLVRLEHGKGALRWFSSLHDFFIRLFINVSGVVLFIIGAFACFGTASQELRTGLSHPSLSKTHLFVLSFIAALISIRLIVFSLSLLSSRFRIWYTAS